MDGSLLYLLTDPVHCMKSVRNNWVTEMHQELLLSLNNVACLGKWSDVCSVFNSEKDHVVKRTSLTYTACYPSNLDMQKVNLMNSVFNEKVVAALKQDKREETAKVVEAFTHLWKILNIKTTHAHVHLNDIHRKPFDDIDDPRFEFLHLGCLLGFTSLASSRNGKICLLVPLLTV